MKPAAAALSSEVFLASLHASGLLAGAELQSVVDRVVAATDIAGAVKDLVNEGKLTSFQADALLYGRHSDLHIGNYDIITQLGQGGMGTVFKARHRRMKRVVALKVLSREVVGQSSFVQRFQREVETIAKLSHPNIVMAFDADEAEIGHFLVMEFVNGRDLASEVQQAGPLSVAEAVRCISQAGAGLEYAHGRGIIHRDIKPANLLRDETGLVKVADLGLARLSSAGGSDGSSLTQAGGIVGTTEFMPPEQALDSTTIDHRADIYSLACTLYFLLTGQPPFSGGSFMAVLLKHRESPIPSLRKARADVPVELDTVFARAMAKNPDARYATMTQFLQALESVKAAGPLSDKRPVRPQVAVSPPSSDMTVAADSAEMLSQMAATRSTAMSSSLVSGGVPSPSEARCVADLTAIVVEPSRTQAGIIRKYFTELGISQLHIIGSGRQAIELARTHQAHVLVSAMHLSDMTGVELARALRAESDLSEVGFVLTTSESDTAEAEVVLRSTPHTVMLAKPFDLRKLARALATATGRSASDIATMGGSQ